MRTSLIAFLIFFICGYTCPVNGQWQKLKQELIFTNAPFPQCHASTIVELGSGNLMSAWFGGKEEGNKDVCIWSAVYNKGTWTAPVRLATGIINDSLRYPCWNPVLFREKGGKLFLFYKVGPNPRQWWGMQITSTDDGKTWSMPVKLPAGILGPIKNKAIQMADGTIISPSSEETKEKWSAHIERSNDKGTSWQRINLDSIGFDLIQPSILDYGHGRLQAVCRSKQSVIVQSWSDDNGKTWGRLSKTALPNPNSGIDAVTLKNGQQLIVYNPTTPGKEWSNGRAKLNVAVSTDGTNWKDIAVLEDGTKEEYSYPAVIQTKDGIVHITYTYDRKNIKYVELMMK